VAALTKAITASGGKPVKRPFVFPGKDEKSFLKLAYVLENTGVGAYNGAGPSLQSKSLLAAAGSIVQIEARHAASIALLTGMSITPNGAFDKPLTTKQVLAAAGPLISPRDLECDRAARMLVCGRTSPSSPDLCGADLVRPQTCPPVASLRARACRRGRGQAAHPAVITAQLT
jgi:hypothetical protein